MRVRPAALEWQPGVGRGRVHFSESLSLVRAKLLHFPAALDYDFGHAVSHFPVPVGTRMTTARPLAYLALSLLLAPAAARATDYTWGNSSGGDWATAANWSPVGAPGAGDNATIALGGTYTVGLTGTQSVNNVTLNAAGATVNGNFGGSLNLGE